MNRLLRLPPQSEDELLSRCHSLQGLTFSQLALSINMPISDHPSERKGWVGQAMELVLGANAGSLSAPDFIDLGIELKTLPINHLGKPAESTFVTSIPLLTVHKQVWQTSQCFTKLRRVLWVYVEDDSRIPFLHRRIGQGFIWSPSTADAAVLANDWSELTFMIGTGKLAEIDARMGEYLQVRPKAANAKSLCYGFDECGNKILTLPRGFYLRQAFTAQLGFLKG